MSEATPGGPLIDDAAGRLIRPYTVSDGRTKPTRQLDLMTMVVATGYQARDDLGPDHANLLTLCRSPITVAEVAAQVRMPATVVKVLLSDLMEFGAVATGTFTQPGLGPDSAEIELELLEAVLDGLRRKL
ncbi:DUF742 domain-containing protein [Micromonospora sp. WMMD1102]|uniref:DUF742 domain-containing protein n=1 Tax=Micromonospora sp. WMMD1102 TaxID=3016105 RepID=UPI0024152DCA|nr:DUF742 domain-containing protein [Micromonospora sp. WMMD1102]MDG4788726.1 DUF742 domain-containing protein [Micromonospora sp. WMMD1102]